MTYRPPIAESPHQREARLRYERGKACRGGKHEWGYWGPWRPVSPSLGGSFSDPGELVRLKAVRSRQCLHCEAIDVDTDY